MGASSCCSNLARSRLQTTYLSAVTGSGLPEPVVANPYRKFAWFLASRLQSSSSLELRCRSDQAVGLRNKVVSRCAEDSKGFAGGKQVAV